MRPPPALAAALFLLPGCAAWQHLQLPMRDGVTLNTNVNFPLGHLEGKKLTAVFDRSPYGAEAIELLADIFVPFGYVGVRQDMRGTKKSGGNWSMWGKSGDDAYDTMKWLTSQKWSNGDVYMMGGSADGLCAFAAARARPPWMKNQFIIWSSSVGYPIIFPGGAYRKSLADFWLQSTVPDDAPAAIAEAKANEMPGPWWAQRMNMTGHCSDIDFPSVHWAGWYDIFLVGQLAAFDCYQHRSSLPGRSKLVIDPLGHCQDGSKYFKNDLNGGDLIAGRVALPVLLALDDFEGNGKDPEGVKAVTFYVMGPDVKGAVGNYWTSVDEFPAYAPTKLYLAGGGGLSPSAPAQAGATEFVYDPAHPVPTAGGNNLNIPCGPVDQRPVENRSDVLVFTTEPYAAAVALTGPVDALLYVSSNCTDTDFTVKVTDVHPDGTSRLLQDGIVRMRWRAGEYGGDQPQLLTPGETYKAPVSLWNTSYVINAGHSIRVAVSSSNSPRFEPNPNTGLPLSAGSKEVLVAWNTVRFGGDAASHVVLPVVELSQLPRHGGVLLAETKWALQSPRHAATLAALRGANGTLARMGKSWQQQALA